MCHFKSNTLLLVNKRVCRIATNDAISKTLPPVKLRISPAVSKTCGAQEKSICEEPPLNDSKVEEGYLVIIGKAGGAVRGCRLKFCSDKKVLAGRTDIAVKQTNKLQCIVYFSVLLFVPSSYQLRKNFAFSKYRILSEREK